MRYPFGAFKNSSNIFRRHVYPPFHGLPYVFAQDMWIPHTEITIATNGVIDFIISNNINSWLLTTDDFHVDEGACFYGTIQIPISAGTTTIKYMDTIGVIEYIKINNSILYDNRIL